MRNYSAQEILRKAHSLREAMTPEKCYCLADEALTALEQARAAVTANSTEETRARLAEAHANAHALILAVTPEMIAAGGVRFTLLKAAIESMESRIDWTSLRPGLTLN